jgi:hypothetical protein
MELLLAEMSYRAVVLAIFVPGVGLCLMFLMMGRLAKKRRRQDGAAGY